MAWVLSYLSSKMAKVRHALLPLPASHLPVLSKNIVADALSRRLFIPTRVSQRLIKEPCDELLRESQQVQEGVVQEIFRAGANHQRMEFSPSPENRECCSLTSAEVSAVLTGHVEWDQGQRVVSWPAQHLEQLISLSGGQSKPENSHLTIWVAIR